MLYKKPKRKHALLDGATHIIATNKSIDLGVGFAAPITKKKKKIHLFDL